MKTKAELELELAELRLEVAGLRAAVEAYRFAFEQIGKPQPQTYTWGDYNWNGGAVWPQTFPVTTWNSSE